MDHQRSSSTLEEDLGFSTKEPRHGRAQPPSPRRVWPILLIIALVSAGAYFYWQRSKSAPSGDAPPVTAGKGGRGFGSIPVVAAKVVKGDIGVYITGIASVTPLYTVTVKSRVDGQLMSVHFKEGDIVRQGEPLAEIDSRPYEVQLEQAQGQLAKDQAQLDNARIDLARYQTLLSQNAVPEQQAATQKATVAQLDGSVKADQGQIDAAKLNIVYCHISAPITGRIGLRLVDPGNIIHASDASGLLVITQIQPISVIFPIVEDQLPAVLQKTRAGARLRVDAYDRDMNSKIAEGTLTTIDNQIDQTTATVKLRATFSNQDNALFPNQFVNARLLVEEKRGVTLAPAAAVQRNSEMTYVYIVKPDSTVTVRQVAVGTTEGDQTEITSGLAPGDLVVMTGVDKLQEGSKVTVNPEAGKGRGKAK